MNVLIPLWPVEPYEDAVTGENCDCSISTSEVVLPGLRIGSGIPNAPRLFLTCDTDRSRNSLSVFHSSLLWHQPADKIKKAKPVAVSSP